MKPKFANHKFLAAAAVATTLAFSPAPARAATLVLDHVEDGTAYTTTGSTVSKVTGIGLTWGLTPQAGSNWAGITAKTTAALSGTVRKTASFGPTFTVAAGTYTLSMFAGQADVSINRSTFTTLVPVLATIGGTEFVDKTVITPYVDPNSSTATWVESEVEYVIPEGSPLIGQEFTWGFDWTRPANARQFAAIYDAVTVDFVPAGIPEPSTALLGGIGMLALLRRRR